MKKIVIITILIILVFSALLTCKNATNTDDVKNTNDRFTVAKKVELSNDEIRNLNDFFTAFSEMYLPTFSKKNIPDSVLIQFGVYYNYHRHFDMFQQSTKDSKASISETHVSDTVFRFFNLKIQKHQSIEGIEYKNKKYIIQNADGEAYRFSQIRELVDSGNGNYWATIEIFFNSAGFTGDVNANPETWKANSEAGDLPQSEGKVKASIQKIKEDGGFRYVLLEYSKL